jgi:hypothetical protein
LQAIPFLKKQKDDAALTTSFISMADFIIFAGKNQLFCRADGGGRLKFGAKGIRIKAAKEKQKR